MSKYFKKFDTHEQYEQYTQEDMILPNVSYCEDNDEMYYNPIHDYSQDYLTFVALEDGTISFNIHKLMGIEYITSISYSTDNGETWTTTANQNNKSEHLVIDVDVNTGDKILWKGTATQTGYFDDYDYFDWVGSFFSSDCEFDAKGNVMSLLYGDNFKDHTTIEKNGAFSSLFYDYNLYDYDNRKLCGIVNAKDMSLPATTLTENCYNSMFCGCTSLTTAPSILPAITLADNCYQCMFSLCSSLTTAPKLPATILAIECYRLMFSICTSLTTAPTLPATTLTYACYQDMFQGCSSLINAPELPATTLVPHCYNSMFYNCTSLTTAPILHATTLDEYCYDYMFYNCTSLTTAPELPATTLANYCYQCMFQNCTSLVTAPTLPATTLVSACYGGMFSGCTALMIIPELPATTLAASCYAGMFNGCTSLTTAQSILPATALTIRCYENMFKNCTSLTTAPELPATTLIMGCYYDMFNGCTNLNYIKAMFTTTPGSDYTRNWLNNVAAIGTFIRNIAATWLTTEEYGVPNGWTIQTATA